MIYDIILAFVNLALLLTVVVYTTITAGMIPWIGALRHEISSSNRGFVTYCSLYADRVMSIRCWLTDGVWLGMVVLSLLWLLLAVYAILNTQLTTSEESSDYYDTKEQVNTEKNSYRNSFVIQPAHYKHESPLFTNRVLQEDPSPTLPHHHSDPNHFHPLDNSYYHNNNPRPISFPLPQPYNPGDSGMPLTDNYYYSVNNRNMEYGQGDSSTSKRSSDLSHGFVGMDKCHEIKRKESKTFEEEVPSLPSTIPAQPPNTYE
ncbi:hypothetical protein BDB01DRAFT_853659 [Pilobolus umbonatus]|nr:hypothetical protein BDB01DRAFT_853659 [Pilobolus umbonatus]